MLFSKKFYVIFIFLSFNLVANQAGFPRFVELPPDVQGEIFNQLDPQDISAWMQSNKLLNQISRKQTLAYVQKQLKKKGINLDIAKDINAADANGNTALMLAVGDQDLHHVVPLLIRLGADVARQDNIGNTVFVKIIECTIIISAAMQQLYKDIEPSGARGLKYVKFWQSLYDPNELNKILKNKNENIIIGTDEKLYQKCFGHTNVFPISILKKLGVNIENYFTLARMIILKNPEVRFMDNNNNWDPEMIVNSLGREGGMSLQIVLDNIISNGEHHYDAIKHWSEFKSDNAI